jgi:hypothetical protein
MIQIGERIMSFVDVNCHWSKIEITMASINRYFYYFYRYMSLLEYFLHG